MRRISFSLFAAWGLAVCVSPAHAQIVAYRNAPASQQATILNAGNGVPLVNIQTPSAAGVSRNTYSQFDVQQAGAILNNSRSNVQTQLGGWVQGNPWLATGTASVILNEIVSATASQLLGTIEVAGARAQVVIANPAGITCAGCGFINANHATLTTGTPIVSNGALEGYRVEGGSIRIEGAGLDARQTDYTDLIARAVEINAGLWANTLKISAGANEVNAEHTQATPITASSAAPAYAIDVAQLGGMYASKIMLVGTEAGIGVRNAGQIGAAAGEVIVSTDGRLHNSGHIDSTGTTRIDTRSGIDNSGTIYAQGDLALSTRGDIDNNGLLAARGNVGLAATGVESRVAGGTSGTLAAGVNPDSTLGSSGGLDVSATTQITVHGQSIAVGTQTFSAATLDLSDSRVSANTITLNAGNGDIDVRRATLTASGTLSAYATQTIMHDDASSSAQQLDLAAHDLSNARGELVQTGDGATAIALAGDFDNRAGRLAVNSRALTIAAARLNNSGGTLYANGETTVSAVDFDNRGGLIQAAGTSRLSVNTSGLLDNSGGQINAASDAQISARELRNTQGQISAGRALQATIAQGLDNTQGTLVANQALTLKSVGLNNNGGTLGSVLAAATIDAGAGALSNAGGNIAAALDLSLTANGLTNTAGTIAGRNVGLNAQTQGFDNSRGQLIADAALNVQSGALTNAGGLIQAGEAMSIDTHGQSLSNSDSGASNGILGFATVTLATGLLDNSSGRISAASNAQLTASELRNKKGQISAGSALQATLSAGLDNSQGTLVANQALTLKSVGLNNDDGTLGSVLAAATIDAGAGALSNAGGNIAAALDLSLTANGLTNTDGAIAARNVGLNAQTQGFDNSRGQLIADAALDVQSGALTNAGGLIQAGEAMNIDTHGQRLSNTDSGAGNGIVGLGAVTLAAGPLDNSGGFIGARNQLGISASDIANSAGGSLSSEQDIVLTATHLDNRGGQMQALGSLTTQVSGIVNNASGLIRAGETVALTAGSVLNAATLGANQGIEGQSVAVAANQIDNSYGAIRANQALSLTSGGNIDNSDGLISSADKLNILDSRPTGKTLAITNSNGVLIADRNLTVDGASLSGKGKLLSLQDLSVKLTSDTVHSGEISANRSASFETSGVLTNSGLVQGGQSLDVRATTLNNEASGEVKAPTLHLTATAADSLTNRGLIDGGDTFIDAVTLNNLGTGRIYGDHLAIAATSLTNAAENDVAPVIAARERLDLGASTIDNSEHALIFSAGDMAIGGALDANRNAIGQAAALNNASATIEALGNLSVSAAQINNTNPHFTTKTVEVGSGVHRNDYQISGSPNQYDESQVTFSSRNKGRLTILHTPDGSSTFFFQYDYTRRTFETQIDHTDPAKLLSGGAMQINAATVLNDTSQIIAGGALSGNIGSLTNTEVPGTLTFSDLGTVYYYWERIKGGNNNNPTMRDNYGVYRPADTAHSLTLKPTLYLGNTAPSGSGKRVDALIVGSAGQSAGEAGAASASLDSSQNVTGIAAPSAPTGQAAAQITSVSAPTGQAVTGITSLSTATGQNVARITQVPSIGGQVIATVAPNTALPNNSLFQANADPASRYLIETDPQFASYRQWLTSDYMLTALAIDPALTQKRLGDGFYEQRLLREQIAELTGRRFLDGYANDEAQYQALMDAGVTVAKAWNLIPGVALSAEQMAALTTDIVWLVEKSITLADGSTQKAFVPQIYARLQTGDLSPSGALIAANDINLELSGDLTNSGTIAGRQLVSLTAENITNLGGRIAGQSTLIAARNDLTNIGGSLAAENLLVATAGNDLTVQSTTRTQVSAQGSRTDIDRVAGLYVSGPNGTLVASAGNDLTLLAATLINANPTAAGSPTASSTSLTAGRDLTLATASESRSQSNVRDGENYLRSAKTSEVGSVVKSTGDITLSAGDNVNVRAASVTSSDGALAVQAGNDLRIEAGQSGVTLDEAHKTKRKGFLSSKTTITHNSLDETRVVESTFSADSVALEAGRDLAIKGSSVIATRDVALTAGNNLSIESASERLNETRYQKTTQSGLFSSGGLGFTIGSRMQSTDQKIDGNIAAASIVGSTDGNVLLRAGNAYRQIGSDVIAAKGDIDINAKTVDILEAREARRSTYESKSKQSGLTVAITSPIISAIQTAQYMSSMANNTEDPRMQLLAAANVGFSASSAANAIKAGQGTTINGKDNQMPVRDDAGKTIGSRDATAAEQVGGINLSISLGSSKSSSATTETSDRAARSTLVAGNDIRISATGAGQDSDLTVQGSTLSAGNTITLKADDEIKLLAAQNLADQHSSNKNSSASIGISYGTSGFLVNAAASSGRGNADGADRSWANTQVTAGKQINLESGGDTSLRGAVVSAKQITARVGGNLELESLQDTSTYNSSQKSAGLGVSVGMGMMSGNLDRSDSKILSDYANVTAQSGFKAGDGGFDVNVKGNTDLKGAVIESTQSAIDLDRNRFFTGGALSVSDLQNKADYSAKSASVSLGTAMSFDGELVPGGTSVGFGKDSGSASSMTLAAISGLAGNTAARTGDVETGIQRIFDARKVENEINAQTQITQRFGQQAPIVAAGYADRQFVKLYKQSEAELDLDKKAALATEALQWDEGGIYRIALHTAIGGLAGGVPGALGAGVASGTALLLQELEANIAASLQKAGANETIANAAGQLISLGTAAGLGAAASGGRIAGTAMATNIDANNRRLHPKELALITARAKEFAARLSANDFPVSESEAIEILKQNAADFVDNGDQRTRNNSSAYQDAQAKQFLQEISRQAGSFTDNSGQQIKYFTTETASGRVLKGDFYNPQAESVVFNTTSVSGTYFGTTFTALNVAGVLDLGALLSIAVCQPCVPVVGGGALLFHGLALRGVAFQVGASQSNKTSEEMGFMVAATAGFPQTTLPTFWSGQSTSLVVGDGPGNGVVLRIVRDYRLTPGDFGVNTGAVTTIGLLTDNPGGVSFTTYSEANGSLDRYKFVSDFGLFRPWLTFRWNDYRGH